MANELDTSKVDSFVMTGAQPDGTLSVTVVTSYVVHGTPPATEEISRFDAFTLVGPPPPRRPTSVHVRLAYQPRESQSLMTLIPPPPPATAEPANYVYAGPSTPPPALPSFRLLVGADLPTPTPTSLGGVKAVTPAAHLFLTGIDLTGQPQSAQVNYTDLAGLPTTGPGSGTVTSVGIATPNIFVVTGSPVTGSGTLTLTSRAQTANTIYAGPASGTALGATFRAMVAADLPSSGVTAGSYTNTNLTVNAQGQITAAANGTGGTGGSFLPITGGTLTGPMGITPTTPGQSTITLNDAAGNNRFVDFQTGGVMRWQVGADNTAETGTGDAGSQFVINGYTDGGLQFNAITIDRHENAVTVPANFICQSDIATWTIDWGDSPSVANFSEFYDGTLFNWYAGSGVGYILRANTTTKAIEVTGNLTIDGTGFATTPAPGDSTTKLATTAFVGGALSGYGHGTVTSVGLTAPSTFTVSGSPVTGSGSLGLAYANQPQYLALASPVGATGAPTFRSLVPQDMGSVSANMVLAGPTVGNPAGYPSWRALQAQDIPSSFLPLTGGTLTNSLHIAPSGRWSQLYLDKDSGSTGEGSDIIGTVNGVSRWDLQLGDSTNETGSGNTGSNFNLYSYNDAGSAVLGTLNINRANFLCSVIPPSGQNAAISLNFPASGTSATIYGANNNTGNPLNRWSVQLGNGSTETGTGNAGSDLVITRYSDTGVSLGAVLTIVRGTGAATFAGSLISGVCSTGIYQIATHILFSSTNPTITSGLGTSPTVTTSVGNAAGRFTVGASGTPTTTTVIGLPASINGWTGRLTDITAGTVAIQTGSTTTSATFTWAAAPANSDVILYNFMAF